MIVGGDGHVQCATGLSWSASIQRTGLSQAGARAHDVVFSDFLFSMATDLPIVMAAYPVSAIKEDSDAVIVAGVNIDWMSKIMGNLGGRPGISAVLIDSTGIVMAAPADQASMVGRALDTIPLLSAIADKAIDSNQATDRCPLSRPTTRAAS